MSIWSTCAYHPLIRATGADARGWHLCTACREARGVKPYSIDDDDDEPTTITEGARAMSETGESWADVADAQERTIRDGEYHVPVAVIIEDGVPVDISLSGEGAPWMYSADPNFASMYEGGHVDDGDWVTPTFREHDAADTAIADAIKPPPKVASLVDAFGEADMGPQFTCSEVDDLCAILCYAGQHVASMVLMASHVVGDEPGDAHYVTEEQ